MKLTYAIALLVGQKDLEIERSNDLLDSIGACEPNRCRMIVIDDGGRDRRLHNYLKFPKQIEPHFTVFDRPKGLSFKNSKGVCGNSILGFQWISRHAPEAAFGMKIDTDALVIAPFAEKLVRAFEAAPAVGVLGANTRSPEGYERDFTRNAALMRHLHAKPTSQSSFKVLAGYLKDLIDFSPASVIRGHITKAVQAGYEYGENCLGGAYAIRLSCMIEINRQGFLDRPEYWAPIDVPEEVVMHMYARAAGYTLNNFVAEGEVFGIRLAGLPFAPEDLLEKGYSIIHSVKNDKRISERDIREFFRSHRHPSTCPNLLTF
jgi:hypothetical protein